MFSKKCKEYILNFFSSTNYIVKKYSRGDIIAIEGDTCISIGLVLEGSIDIKRTLGSKVIHVTSFSVGGVFGEVIAFSDINIYPATVVASSSCEIMFINKNDFIKFCTCNEEFLSMFLNTLTNKIFLLNNSITNLTFNNLRQRICNFLINEYKVQKTKNIKLNMTKEKLSEFLGVTRPSLSRELINMKKLRLIDYSRNNILILDLEEIENLIIE